MTSDIDDLAKHLTRGKQAMAGQPPAQRRGSSVPTLRNLGFALIAVIVLAMLLARSARREPHVFTGGASSAAISQQGGRP